MESVAVALLVGLAYGVIAGWIAGYGLAKKRMRAAVRRAFHQGAWPPRPAGVEPPPAPPTPKRNGA